MTRGRLIFFLSFATCSLAHVAASADDAAPYDWSGLYAGVHAGAGLGLVDVKDPFGGSIYGDWVRAPGLLVGGQLGYNWQFGTAVLGLEADASWADMDGTNTCFAYSGFYIPSNCRVHTGALGTLTGRLGWAVGDEGRTLLYGKAGAAWRHSDLDAFVNYDNVPSSTSVDGIRWGFALGGGLERALNERWSFKAEYDYLGFGNQGFTAPASHYQTVVGAPGTVVAVPAEATTVFDVVHQIKFGLNYRLSERRKGLDAGWGWGTLLDGSPPSPSGAEIELGVRYVHGWSRLQSDLGRKQEINALASRLTYKDVETDGQEIFARLDAPFDLMMKGVVGSGSGGGHFNDEDFFYHFGPTVDAPYSNTSDAASGKMRYLVVDVGYDWWRAGTTKVAPFVGYSYLRQELHNNGCHQIADPHSDCRTPNPYWVTSILDKDSWHSLRLGLAVDTRLAPRLKASADIAYLPYVKFSNTDYHILRSLISPEWGHGTGLQLEGLLSYAITGELSLGVGARYWSMQTDSGATDFGGGGDIIAMRFATEQAALLVQGSYTFDALAAGAD